MYFWPSSSLKLATTLIVLGPSGHSLDGGDAVAASTIKGFPTPIVEPLGGLVLPPKQFDDLVCLVILDVGC